MFKPKFRYTLDESQTSKPQALLTQHRTAARRVVDSLSCLAYHKMLHLLPKSRVGGISGPEAYHEKNTPNVDACARIHFQMKIFDWAPLPTPNKKLAFCSIILLSNSTLQILSSTPHSSKLHSSTSISALLLPDCSISSYYDKGLVKAHV